MAGAGGDGVGTLGASATLSGVPLGWTLYDGSTALAAPGGVASLAVADLGSLGVAVPDGTGPQSASLTLTGSAHEGGSTTSGSEVLVVSVSAVAEAPVFSGTSQWSVSDEASAALSGVAVAGADGDDTLGARATLSRALPARRSSDLSTALAAPGGVASLAVADLGSLGVAVPDGTGPQSASLT